MQIHKFVLTSNLCKVSMPQGAKVLCVQAQKNMVCIWAEVEEWKPLLPRLFVAYPTGQKLPVTLAPQEYIGTVQMGAMVWHVYEIKE